MEVRRVLKLLKGFAEREMKEKRADRVVLCRARMSEVIRRGRAPDFRVRAVKGYQYLVCMFGGAELTVHFFDGRGSSLGAVALTGTEAEKEWQSISMTTSTIFRRP